MERARDVQAPEGNVVVVAEPPDAEVAVDGVRQGLASDFDGVHGALKLSTGSHVLMLSHTGFAPFSADIYAGEGRQRLQVALDRQ
jgi:hypothetical protein